MPYACDQHPENAGSALLTNLSTGDTLVMCPVCLPEVLRGVADLADPAAPDSAMTEQAPAEVEGSPNAVETAPDGTTEYVPDAPEDFPGNGDEMSEPGGVSGPGLAETAPATP